MVDPLILAEPCKGMFGQYEGPLQLVALQKPFFGRDLDMHLVSEAADRLSQLDRFYGRAWASVHEAIATQPRLREDGLLEPSEYERNREALDSARDFAEAFYVLGFKVYDITKTLAERGSLQGPPRPANFCSVRNHLIIHPDCNAYQKGQTVVSWSLFVTNRDNRGVVLKNKRLRYEEGAHQDPGLGPNAIELQTYLRDWIVKAMM